MKSFQWDKELINGKWFTRCTSHEHVPMIQHLSTGFYKVKGADGKPRIEKKLKDAIKFAIEVYYRYTKENRKLEKEEK